jgi:putative membrane protein
VIQAGVCAGLLLSSGVVRAQGATPAAPAQRSEGDQAFLKQALGVNQLELQLGHLAVERGTTPEVKAQGQKMIQKHTELGGQLSALAQQSGMSGDPVLSPDQAETLAHVKSQPADSFDAVFKKTVDSGHAKELAMYQDELGRTSNPQLRALSEQRVAALEQSVGAGAQSKGR